MDKHVQCCRSLFGLESTRMDLCDEATTPKESLSNYSLDEHSLSNYSLDEYSISTYSLDEDTSSKVDLDKAIEHSSEAERNAFADDPNFGYTSVSELQRMTAIGSSTPIRHEKTSTKVARIAELAMRMEESVVSTELRLAEMGSRHRERANLLDELMRYETAQLILLAKLSRLKIALV